MAKKKDFRNVAEGFFLDTKPTEQPAPAPVKIEQSRGLEPAGTIPERQLGRNRAADLKPDDILIKTTIYLTKETKKTLNVFALENDIDKSEAVRQLIRGIENDNK